MYCKRLSQQFPTFLTCVGPKMMIISKKAKSCKKIKSCAAES